MLAPSQINGVDPRLLTTTGRQEAIVTFNFEDALFESTLGFVTADDDGNILDSGLVFANTDGPDRGSAVNRPGDQVSLGAFDDDTQIGFFFIQSGAELGFDITAGDIRIDGSLAGAVPPSISLEGDDGFLVDITSPTFFTHDSAPDFPLNNPLNDGGNTQFISDVDDDGKVTIGVEDRILSRSDGDFNDLSFSVEFVDAPPPVSLDVFLGNGGVLFNDGAGGFVDSGQRLNSALDSLSSVALGDLDGDGDLDAVTTSIAAAPGDHARVFINDGNGFFTDTGQSFGSNVDDVILGDVDGDGDLDALFTNVLGIDFDPEENTIFLNDGTGFLVDGAIDFPPSNPVNPDRRDESADFTRTAEFGDLDNDGDLDAVFANALALDQILINDGTGNFSEAPRTGTIRTKDVALGDMDNDGDLDAVFAGAENLVMFNDGAGNFSQGAGFLGGFFDGQAVDLGDLDGDGDLDAVLASGERGDRLFLNDGKGTLILEDILSPEGSDNIVFGDLDGDSDLDVVLVQKEINGGGGPNAALLNDGNANFVDSGFSLATGSLALGDLDQPVTDVV